MALGIGLAVGYQLFQFPAAFGIVRIINDNFLAAQLSGDAKAQQLHEESLVALHIEYHAVRVGLVGEPSADRQQHHAAEPFAEVGIPGSDLGIILTGHVDDVVEDEEHNAYHHRDAYASFADDGSQRGSDEKEQQAGEAERVFLLCLHQVAAHLGVQLCGIAGGAELALGLHGLCAVQGVFPCR